MTREPKPGVAYSDEPTIARRASARPRVTVSSPPDSEVRPLGATAVDSLEPPSASRASIPYTTHQSTGGANMQEVWHAEESTRAHGFAAAIAIVSLAVTPLIAFLGGDPLRQRVAMISTLVMGLASVGIWWLTRIAEGSRRYRRNMLRAYGCLLVVGVLFVELYFGMYSPAPVILTLGVYYLGQSVDPIAARLLPAFVVVSFAVLGLLTSFGVIADASLFPADDVPTGAKVFAVFACSTVLVLTMLLARLSRTALHQAIDSSRELMMLAQQRGAQLAEANNQLDHAMRIAVGKPGRYTGELAGQYSLGVVIGVGAIGEVYEGQHVETGELSAVKLLQADALARPDLVERFLREGDVTRQVESPYVTRVLEVGELSGGAPYLAMELLRGRDLATRLRQQGPLGLVELQRLARHLGGALERAHAAGVVHRDLKPLNVFEVDGGGETVFKILDFGISKVDTSSGTLTQHGVVGTPGYMSPEQARGADVDHRSDIFSAAVVLYRAMTGQPAFSGDSAPQILFDIVYKSPVRPSSIAKELPRDLDLVMSIALSKDAKYRFDSARELVDAFCDACSNALSGTMRARGQASVRAQPWGRPIPQLSKLVS